MAPRMRLVAAERHVAAASGHICVVQDGGAVASRGNATTTGKLTPPVGVTFHAVTAGDDFSCGLTAVNSSLLCWGALPGGTSQLPPVTTFFVDAHTGPRHVCGLVPNGTVLCYGDASSLGAVNVPQDVVFQGVTAGAQPQRSVLGRRGQPGSSGHNNVAGLHGRGARRLWGCTRESPWRASSGLSQYCWQ